MLAHTTTNAAADVLQKVKNVLKLCVYGRKKKNTHPHLHLCACVGFQIYVLSHLSDRPHDLGHPYCQFIQFQ